MRKNCIGNLNLCEYSFGYNGSAILLRGDQLKSSAINVYRQQFPVGALAPYTTGRFCQPLRLPESHQARPSGHLPSHILQIKAWTFDLPLI